MITLPVPRQTPALVIHRPSLIENLSAMQQACDRAGVKLRPHGKMHKCSTLGLLQQELGASGLCCQTVGEAEVFARAGILDLLVSAPLPSWGAARIARLTAATGATISVVCDGAAQIDRLGAAALAEQVELGCLVDVNIGMHRVGCRPEEAPALASRIVRTTGLRYAGVQAYFGHIQHLDPGRAEANAQATGILESLLVQLAQAGLKPATVTGGGSGTYALDLANGIFTELQCGSYALMDAEYVDCGGPLGNWPFKPALFIAASVVSAKHKSHVTIDVGLKATTLDVAPRVVAGAAIGSRWRSLGDEHGAIVHPDARSDLEAADSDPTVAWPNDAPEEGGIVWLQPGHCDPTINLYDAFFVTRGDGGLDRWPIDARRTSA